MTTKLNLPTGPTNKQIIERAFDMLGMSGEAFGRQPDEYTLGMRILSAFMREWPFDQLGYIDADYGDGEIEEKSGIPFKFSEGVSGELASRIAGAKGKAFAMPKSIARARDMIFSTYAIPTDMDFPNKTPSGNGAYYPFLNGGGDA